MRTAAPGCSRASTNLAISKAVEAQGFYYAPDPSSQIACSIGGNVAENAGGVHCLKYGLTTNNILGLEIVLMGGEVLRLGGKRLDCEPYDLIGLMTGSEGLLGVVTEVTVRLLRRPPLARALLLGFESVEAAARCVGAIIAKGVIPAGLEMMDRATIEATERFQPCGYPREAEAMLIVELDGTIAEVDHLVGVVEAIATGEGATTVKASTSEAERLQFWAGRKNAFPAVACIGPDYLCMDGTIPRGRLARGDARHGGSREKYGLRVANVFHAGDGNLHPLILYDAQSSRRHGARRGASAPTSCASAFRLGGVLTGEHGVGVEKRDLMGEMFSETDLEQQMRVKCAFDPQGLLNPGKVFPTLHRCAELGAMHVHGGALPFPDIPQILMSLAPQTESVLAELLRDAAARAEPLRARRLGIQTRARPALAREKRYRLSAFSGVSLYEPEELVLTAGAATPRAEIEALLDAHGQELAFEPIDFGTLLGVSARHDRRPRRDRRLGTAPHQGRGRARSSARLSLRDGAGRDRQIRRARDEERHGL